MPLKRTKTLWANDSRKAWASMTFCLLVCLGSGAGYYLLLTAAESIVPETTEARELALKLRIIKTLMLLLPEILTAVCSEIEHLGTMHNAVGRDKYRWFHHPLALTAAAAVIGIMAAIFSASWGWLTLLWFGSTMLLIWIPRLLFKPWF